MKISRRSDEIRSEMNAKTTVERVKPPGTKTPSDSPTAPLPERRHEVFKLPNNFSG